MQDKSEPGYSKNTLSLPENANFFSFASMPYYHIPIWTKDHKPYQSIRLIEGYNVDAVFRVVKQKAETVFRSNLVDVEIAMLPKMCTAVQKHLRSIQHRSGM